MKAEKISSDELRLDPTEGGLFRILFSLPFIAVGIGVIVAGLMSAFSHTKGIPIYFALPFGSIFTLVGLIVGFGRCRYTLRKGANPHLIKHYSLILPLWTSRTDLSENAMVIITKEIRRSDKSTYTVYPVRIVNGINAAADADESSAESKFNLSEEKIQKAVGITEFRDYSSSRHIAETIAEFYGFLLGDQSTGTFNVRKPDELNLPYHEVLRKRGEKVELPPQPEAMQSRVNETDYGVEIEIPVPPPPVFLKIFPVIIFFIGGIISIVVIGTFLSQFSSVPVGIKAIIGVFMVIGVFVPIIVLRKIWSKQNVKSLKIEISEDGLSVWKNGKETKSFPLQEIEEIVIPRESDLELPKELKDPNNPAAKLLQNIATAGSGLHVDQPLIIRSDRDMEAFGAHLSAAEKKYLHAVISRALLVLSEEG